MRKRTLHKFEKKWHPDTLEMQRRVRKLLRARGRFDKATKATYLDVSSSMRIYHSHRGELTVYFQGNQVYCGHDDIGPWYEDDPWRAEIRDALIVLRTYTVLDELADV